MSNVKEFFNKKKQVPSGNEDQQYEEGKEPELHPDEKKAEIIQTENPSAETPVLIKVEKEEKKSSGNFLTKGYLSMVSSTKSVILGVKNMKFELFRCEGSCKDQPKAGRS